MKRNKLNDNSNMVEEINRVQRKSVRNGKEIRCPHRLMEYIDWGWDDIRDCKEFEKKIEKQFREKRWKLFWGEFEKFKKRNILI